LVIILLFDTDFEEEVSVITTVKQRGEAPFGRRFNVGPREAISFVEPATRICRVSYDGKVAMNELLQKRKERGKKKGKKKRKRREKE
jgi:hypothetical protein